MRRAQRPSVLAALLTGRSKLFESDFAVLLPQGGDALKGAVDLLLPSIDFRHDSGDRASVARNDQGFAPLHVVQKLREMSFCFRGLNFAHPIFDQSIRLV